MHVKEQHRLCTCAHSSFITTQQRERESESIIAVCGCHTSGKPPTVKVMQTYLYNASYTYTRKLVSAIQPSATRCCHIKCGLVSTLCSSQPAGSSSSGHISAYMRYLRCTRYTRRNSAYAIRATYGRRFWRRSVILRMTDIWQCTLQQRALKLFCVFVYLHKLIYVLVDAQEFDHAKHIITRGGYLWSSWGKMEKIKVVTDST